MSVGSDGRVNAAVPRGDALRHFDRGRGIAALWFGMLAGPAAWFLHLNVSYALVRYICLNGGRWLLHLTTGVTLVLAAAGVWVAWRSWKRMGEPAVTRGPGTLGRSRFMALGGLGLSAFFLAIILLGWLPGLVLDPCAEL